ncbi:MAG: hypothetical protein ACHREM_06335 [Polyangiales bacterium]
MNDVKNPAPRPTTYFEVTVGSVCNARYPDIVIVGPAGTAWVAGDAPGVLAFPRHFVATQDEAEALVAEIRERMMTLTATKNMTAEGSARHE